MTTPWESILRHFCRRKSGPTCGRGSPRHVRTNYANGCSLPAQMVPKCEPRKTKIKVAGTRPGRRHPFDLPLKRMQKPAEHLLALRLTDNAFVSVMLHGFGSPPFRSANLATHHLWRKTLITILSRALSLVWHQSNGRDGARPAVVCY